MRRVPADVLEPRDSRGGVHQGVVADVDDGRTTASTRSSARVGRAARRGARRHRGSAQPRRDPSDGGCGGRRRRGACRARARRRAGGAAAKASAGAMAHVKIAEVVNIARAMEELKEPASGRSAWRARRRKLRCDGFHAPDGGRAGCGRRGAAASGAGTVRFPGVDSDARPRGSLNVSVAAGIVLFEAVRQRRQAGSG